MRILALDYGEKRLGFAVSDPMGIIATPLRVVEVASDKEALAETRHICEEVGAEKIVVGMPINMNGTKGPMAVKVNAFCEDLSKIISVPVDQYDERLSSATAERVLIEGDVSRAKRKGLRDKLAAQIILQSYMEAQSI
ncbi:Holliday junction resolvase RuvX [Verrucomicrobiota bacterium]